jgi:hypothetical protein
LDLEQKLTVREKEIDLLSSQNQRTEARRDLYCQTLDQMAAKDKGFSTLLLKLKQGLQTFQLSDTTTKSADLQSTIVHSSNNKS